MSVQHSARTSLVSGLLMKSSALGLGLCLAMSVLSAQTLPVREFVHRLYPEGLPYDEARAYPPSVVTELAAMLNDPEESPHWTNIVGVMGIVGEDSTAKILIDFARRGDGRITPDAYRAKSGVLLALGFLANHTGSRAALDYLMASADPSVWASRGFRWSSPFHSSQEDRDRRLSKTALIGLALTGKPEAAVVLGNLGAGRNLPAGVQTAATMSVATEALRHLRVIAQYGLSGYYARGGVAPQ